MLAQYGLNLPPMDRRLQKRYTQLVREHLNSSNRNAAGPFLLPGETQAASATQATWRFLKNPNVQLTDLAEPLREVGRSKARESDSPFVLLAHDWCKLKYDSHTTKADLRQLTHELDVGYELTTALLIDAASGEPLAPMQTHVKTADAVYSTAENPPACEDHHLDHVEPTMAESADWGLERQVVHVIDREADAVRRMRQWASTAEGSAGHRFLVRCDDRRVLWKQTAEGEEQTEEESWLISEIADHFDGQLLFQHGGEALYRGTPVTQEVAETEIVLHRPAKVYNDGVQGREPGEPLRLRLVITRLVDEEGYILAQWTLLTNVWAAEVSAYTVARWYYWRWRIETYFKLLKSHGQELENWRQQTGLAITRRLLVASMACVVVWSLQQDDSETAAETRKVLVRLSGRQMKHGVESTAPALLAGYMTLLSVSDLLCDPDIDIGQLTKMAADALPFKIPI